MAVTRPSFIEKLAKLYNARLVRCVALTGYINDLFLLEEDGKINSFSLEELLQRELSNIKYLKLDTKDKFIILTMKSDGAHFVSEKDKNELSCVYAEHEKSKALTTIEAVRLAGGLLRSAAEKRKSLKEKWAGKESEEYLRPLCVIIDQANMIFPNLDVGRMTSEDKEVWKYFYDLLRDENIWPDVKTADNRPDFIILLSPTMAELNENIFSLPKVENIEITPDKELRDPFVKKRLLEIPIPNLCEGKTDAAGILVKDATGLPLRVLDDLITAAQRDPTGSPLNRQTITAEINKRYGLELRGTINIIRPNHTIDDLIGRRLVARLKFFADETIDNPETSPAGVVFTGPNGVGKTYVAEAFGVYSKRAFISLGAEIKSKWYGEEGILLEKVERVVANYEKTIIFVDEADAKFGIMHKSATHEAEKQSSSRIVEMIGNPKYRGKILWILATTRPDLLEPDFVRPGRCSLFIPICDPEDEEDRQAFFQRMLAKIGKAGLSLTEEEKEILKGKTVKENEEFAASDYGKFIEDFVFEKRFHEKVSKEDFHFNEFCALWRPAALRIGRQRKFQLLQAALLADWRQLLPKIYREKSDTEIRKEIEEMRLSGAIDIY